MQNRFALMIIFVAVIIVFLIGNAISDQGIDVAGCKASWKLLPVSVSQSDLCPAKTCEASPASQQHNAIVDAVVCACEKAKAGQYADDATNKKIEEVVKNYFGYTNTASNLCEQQGNFLTKISYG